MDSQQRMASATLTLVLVGFFGNALSFLIFSRPHMRASSVNVLLCGLSIIDFSLLLLSLPTFVIPNIGLWANRDSLTEFLAYSLNYVYPVNLIMQTCSVFTVMMITVERWIAVCHPLKVRVWCTANKSRLALLIIFIFSWIYNFVRFFEYKLIYEGNRITYERDLRDPETHRVYYIGYYTVLFTVTHFVIPFTLMVVMNAHLVAVMWQGRRMRQSMTRQQQREQSTTVMLLIVTLVFVLCNTLNFILNILECIYPTFFNDPDTTKIAYMLNDLSVLLVIFNSATTFIVYFIFSEKYRQTLFFMLKNRNGCFTSISDYNNYTAMSRTASMRITSEGPNSGLTRQGSKMSTNSHGAPDVPMRALFMQKRSVRAASEYNDRTFAGRNGALSRTGARPAATAGRAPDRAMDRPEIPELLLTEDRASEIRRERPPSLPAATPNETIAYKCNKLWRNMHKSSSASDRVMPKITVTFSDEAPRRNSDIATLSIS